MTNSLLPMGDWSVLPTNSLLLCASSCPQQTVSTLQTASSCLQRMVSPLPRWMVFPLPQQMVSPLPQWMVSLPRQMASSLPQWMAPSLNEQPFSTMASSWWMSFCVLCVLGRAASSGLRQTVSILPWWMASLNEWRPSMNSLPQQMASSLPQWSASSLNTQPPSTNCLLLTNVCYVC